jgi:hypothetical protein
MSNLLKEALEDLYLNKPFVYKSKYGGRTQCICTEVVITNSFIFDEETSTIIDLLLKGEKPIGSKGKDYQLFNQPQIHLRSENNHLYAFPDCYILMKEDETIW